MMHSDVEKTETVERYIRNQLAPADRQAFEEHFLGCDECFEQLQAAERFAAGMHHAAERGLLDVRSQFQAMNFGWFAWAFGAMVCIALVMAGLAGWAYFGQLPRLRNQLRQAAAQLKADQQSRTLTEQALPVEQAEANVPLVILQASRAREEAASVTLKPDDKQLVLWIEPGPTRYHDFRLDVFSSDNHLITSVNHLRLSRYGALAAALPAQQLPTGDFRITLTGQNPSPAAPAGEYHLKIRRP
jgi:Putative zinc-finger